MIPGLVAFPNQRKDAFRAVQAVEESKATGVGMQVLSMQGRQGPGR